MMVIFFVFAGYAALAIWIYILLHNDACSQGQLRNMHESRNRWQSKYDMSQEDNQKLLQRCTEAVQEQRDLTDEKEAEIKKRDDEIAELFEAQIEQAKAAAVVLETEHKAWNDACAVIAEQRRQMTDLRDRLENITNLCMLDNEPQRSISGESEPQTKYYCSACEAHFNTELAGENGELCPKCGNTYIPF